MTTKIKISILTILLCLLALSVGVMFGAEVRTRDIDAAIMYDNPIDFGAPSGIRWNPGNGAFEIFSMTGLSYFASGIDVDVFGNVAAAATYEKSTTTNTSTYHVMKDIEYDASKLRAGSNFATVRPALEEGGVFDGKNHRLIDFPMIPSSQGSYTAIFNHLNKGTIRNIEAHYTAAIEMSIGYGSIICYENADVGEIDGCSLTGAKITSTQGTSQLAGIAHTNRGIIQNCTNEADITAAAYLGGIVMANWGLISNCVNFGKLTTTRTDGEQHSGGIVGREYAGGSIENCTNYGEITDVGAGSHNFKGGIMGSAAGNFIIDGCKNYGKITTVSNIGRIGGIAGHLSFTSVVTSTIKNSINYGDVTSFSQSVNAGGIVSYTGGNATYELQNCTNSGYVRGTIVTGGIIAYADSTTIKKLSTCTNEGEIDGMTISTARNGMYGGADSTNWSFTNCTSINSVGIFTWNSTALTPDEE